MYCVENTFFSSFNLQPSAYFRYIDDIFIMWPHGIDTFESFLDNANRTHPNICFTHGYSTTAVSFFDVAIEINNGIISTSLHTQTRQPSLSQLHQLSSYAHKKSIVFSKLLRYKRICSDRKNFIKHCKELVKHFLHIGYPINVILKQWDKQTKYTELPCSHIEKKLLTITFHLYRHTTLQLFLQIN